MVADRVLFIDAEALVLDKPAGLAVHPGPRTPHSLEDMLDALRVGFQRRPSPVHRLDRDTSRCLLLSRNTRAHPAFPPHSRRERSGTPNAVRLQACAVAGLG